MTLLHYKKSIIALVAIICGSQVVYSYIAWKKKKKKITKEINEVILISDTSQMITSKHSITKSVVSLGKERILFYLNQSRYTLDICMYALSDRDIAYLIQKLHYQGVKIRLIVDAVTDYSSNSEARRLERMNAIEMRWKRTENMNYIMHHKFCVIDASADKNKKLVPFFMSGSLNWTKQSFGGNCESMVVMSEPKLVQQYKEEFEKLWKKFALPPVFYS